MAKVTGIGGIFFKCKDPKAMNAWYKEHLDIEAGEYGASIHWGQGVEGAESGITQWTTFPEHTKYFDPSQKDFMINYLVDDLEVLVATLKKDGVTLLDEIATYDYGRFIHILDPEGNKIELWEPKRGG